MEVSDIPERLELEVGGAPAPPPPGAHPPGILPDEAPGGSFEAKTTFGSKNRHVVTGAVDCYILYHHKMFISILVKLRVG